MKGRVVDLFCLSFTHLSKKENAVHFIVTGWHPGLPVKYCKTTVTVNNSKIYLQ